MSKYKKRSYSDESDEWVEKSKHNDQRDDWMGMTGMLKTYTKEDIKPKIDPKEKKNIDSYNPSTSTRELNPYWRDGGSGLPQTSDEIRKKKLIKPRDDDDDDYYSRSSKSHEYDKSRYRDDHSSSRRFKKPKDDEDLYYTSKERSTRDNDNRDKYHKEKKSSYSKSGSWRKVEKYQQKREIEKKEDDLKVTVPVIPDIKESQSANETPSVSGKYLSDEKLNKLAAKIVKAEIMGDTKLVKELKSKLEAAREFRKQNPQATADGDEGVLLLSTNSMGNSRPLTKSYQGDPNSKGSQRKAVTHLGGERQKYFGNDDNYNLAEMFEQEKYGSNFDNDAELANTFAKHKNPNDDIEDIFIDKISRNKNEAKDDMKERDRAIKQHSRIEKSLDGCEYCVDSKCMLKHLMVSSGSKVYLSLPAKKSLVPDHCIITTIQHHTCVTALDEDVWEEIMDYRKALTQFFNSQDMDVVFFETAIKLHKYPHLVINCVPLPRDVGDMAAIYFKKALLECEAEWSMNKKVIELKSKNVRKGVPKGLPYFWVDFAMDPGFAHVIEDQRLFPTNFAEEIIGGILDLDHTHWKKPQREQTEQQRKKVLEFVQKWRSFDTVSKR